MDFINKKVEFLYKDSTNKRDLKYGNLLAFGIKNSFSSAIIMENNTGKIYNVDVEDITRLEN
ncbi:MAG: hypothetical protein M0R03_08790 [Novosphingobium sp.]|nr:hypothetical protein [Novosphingobium sp.]